MTDEKDIVQEIPAQEQPETTQEQPQPEKQQVHTPKDSFKELREKAERAEREKRQLELRLEALEAAAQKPEEPTYEVEEDDLVSGKHLKARDKKIQKELEELRKQAEESRRISYELKVEREVSSTYPDFYSVVNEKNVAQLAAKYPDLAQSIAANKDMLSQSKAVYNAIKALNLSGDDPYKAEKERIAQNAAKPGASAGAAAQKTNSPLTQVNSFVGGMTPEMKKKIWADAVANSKKQ